MVEDEEEQDDDGEVEGKEGQEERDGRGDEVEKGDEGGHAGVGNGFGVKFLSTRVGVKEKLEMHGGGGGVVIWMLGLVELSSSILRT